jgi:hypothetical protein
MNKRKLGTSIEAGPRHLSCRKIFSAKKKKAATAVLFFI